MLKKLIVATALFVATLTTTAQAEYRLIVPSGPGSGGATWASVVAEQLTKFTDEPIVLQHVPGARNIPGLNMFHNKFRFDDKTIVVSFGSHSVNYLLENVDYKFSDYTAIGMMNLDLIVGHHKDHDPINEVSSFAGTNAMNDALAVGIMICGPQPSVDAHIACWKKKMKWVNGVKGSGILPMYLRGELNVTRDPPPSWLRHYANEPNTRLWFTHGIMDLKTGKQIPNPNYPDKLFEDVYEQTWGVKPSGDLWEAYHLARTFNNVLQKVLWVNKGNPNAEKLTNALRAMLADEDAVAAIVANAGKYEWIVGDKANEIRDKLNLMIKKDNYSTLVKWYREAYGTKSKFKPEIVNE